MKNILGENFGVRFYRRAPQRKAVQKKKMIELNLAKKFKKSELKMIFYNKVIDDRKIRKVGFFDVLKLKTKRQESFLGQAKDDLRCKALWMAAQNGDCYALRLLVMDGVDLDARDAQGRTALNIATQYNQKQAIKTLMAAKEMRRMAILGELPNSVFFEKFNKNKKRA